MSTKKLTAFLPQQSRGLFAWHVRPWRNGLMKPLVALLLLAGVGCGNDPEQLPAADPVFARAHVKDAGTTITTPTPDASYRSAPVSVPAGSFMMGCNQAIDTQCGAAEFPYHMVTLSAFSIDATEVTKTAYDMCVAAGACTIAGDGKTYGPDDPLRDVTWHQADAYCRWLGKRLPTEAEWEYAARGTDGRIWPTGSSAPSCAQALTMECGASAPEAVSSTDGASPFGALGMAGNVQEFTNDWYDPGYYSVSPSTDPPGPASGQYKSARGGSFSIPRSGARASRRIQAIPDAAYDDIGFRCAQ